jgi:hypothetical protein
MIELLIRQINTFLQSAKMLLLCIISSVLVSTLAAVATSHGHIQQTPAFVTFRNTIIAFDKI